MLAIVWIDYIRGEGLHSRRVGLLHESLRLHQRQYQIIFTGTDIVTGDQIHDAQQFVDAKEASLS